MVERWQQEGLYFAATFQEKDGFWTVWCSFEPLVADNPIHERAEQVIWFEIKRTKEAGVTALLEEIG